MTPRRRIAALAAAVVLTAPLSAVLTACGSERSSSSASFNDADVTFAQEMIPHHQGAIEMADLAADRAQSPQVIALAKQISAAQGPEIDQMTGWLDQWGAEVPQGGSMADMSMPGMMTDEQMATLTAAQGASFDRLFLQLMTEHHQGAVDMATTEIGAGESTEAMDLARTIESDQTAQIAQMQRLRKDL